MPRVYDDISHLRQPYMRTLLDGSDKEAVALGTYMTSGPVDAKPLAVHQGFGVYATSGRFDQPALPIHAGIGEYSGRVDPAPLAIHRGIGAAPAANPALQIGAFVGVGLLSGLVAYLAVK